MKVKTSLTLSKATLRAVDKLIGKRGNRSAFIEEAVREYVLQKQREVRDAHDLAIYRKHHAEYDAFFREGLVFGAPLDLGEDVSWSAASSIACVLPVATRSASACMSSSAALHSSPQRSRQ